MNGSRRALAGCLALVLFTLVAGPLAAQCSDPPGDVNDDGLTNVVDAQCSTLLALYQVGGSVGLLPECADGEPLKSDTNCDGAATVSDVQVVIALALGLGLGDVIDTNGNNCPDACDVPPGEVFAGAVVIAEIMINPKLVSDGIGEWFEVINTTDAALPINGWVLSDNGSDSHTVSSTAEIPPGGVFVFGRGANFDINGGVPVDYEYSGFTLSNASDEVVITADGMELDRVEYTSAMYPFSVGVSLNLDSSFGTAETNDDPAYWCAAEDVYGVGDFGTPGVLNPSCFTCGNNLVEIGEECDNGSANNDELPDACRTDCTLPSCGDGVCDSAENCGTCEVDCGPCGPTLCGGKRCRADQECIADKCVFPCDGALVPGDYASINEAVEALSPVGGTICVQPGTYPENLVVSPSSSLTIIGTDAADVILQGNLRFTYSSGSGPISVRGMAVTAGLDVDDVDDNHPLTLTALEIRNSVSSDEAALFVSRDDRNGLIVVEGCDIVGPDGKAAVRMRESSDFSSTGLWRLYLESCFIHDSATGVSFYESGASNFSDSALEIRNNTIIDNERAIDVGSLTTLDADIRVYNNVIAENLEGLFVNIDNNAGLFIGGNTYAGNATNLGFDATFAATDRVEDPLLSYLSVPPEPSSSSPLIGTGVAAQATDLDYWAEPRDGTPDRGAVEFLCSLPPCEAIDVPACGDAVCAGEETCATCPGDCGACDPAECAGGCLADQDCVAGQCTFPCDGALVPGDYATIQDAINALSPGGGTVCVQPGSYSESLSIQPQSNLSLIGPSRDAVTLTGNVTFSNSSGSGELVFRGFSVAGEVNILDTSQNHPVVIDSVSVAPTGTSSNAHAIEIRRDDYRPTVEITRSDLAGAAAASALYIFESSDFSSTGLFDVEVRNSYLHDSAFGVRYVESGASNFSDSRLELLHNTILDNETGIEANSATVDFDLIVRGNLVAECENGAVYNVDNQADVTSSHNAFGNNSVNFAGAAFAVATDVLGDPELSYATVPPGLAPASSLIGAGFPDFASEVDFFGLGRDALPDIGAVEFQCATPPCSSAAPTCGDGVCNGAENCATCGTDCGTCDPADCEAECLADQFCVAGECQFACTGSSVPGDYATIQQAINALSPVGGTICIAPGAYNESLGISPASGLSLIGASRESVTLTGNVNFSNSSGSGQLLLRGVTVLGEVFINDTNSNHPIELDALRVAPTSTASTADAIEIRRDDYRPTVDIDRSDLAGAAAAAALNVIESSDFSSTGLFDVEVRNSYLHDSNYGVRFLDSGASNFSDSRLYVFHNTILDNGTGVLVTSSTLDLNAQIRGNVVSGNEVGLDYALSSADDVVASHNGLGDNAINFAGSAFATATDLVGDPKLDFTTVPPGLAADSLLIGQGYAEFASQPDYFGRPRDVLPDIGAVERQCAAPPCVSAAPTCGDGTCNGAENCATCPNDCGVCDADACGGACLSDQNCVAGVCTFSCSGSSVPGDYDSLGAAVAALSPVGGTICLGAGTFAESVTVAPQQALTVIGVGRVSTTIDGTLNINHSSGSGGIVFRGFRVNGGVDINDTTQNHAITLDALTILNSGTSSAHGIDIRRDDYRPNVQITRCDVAGSATAAAINVTESSDFSSTGLMDIEVFSSYLHDSSFGFRFIDSGASNFSDSSVTVVGNTLSDNGTAIEVTTSTIDLDLNDYNNLIVENERGISLFIDNQADRFFGGNALFGNGVNFEGTATSASTDVFEDPALDFSTTPPTPSANSPLVGQGVTAITGYSIDFFGTARDATPDIGAVERDCGAVPCAGVGVGCGNGICGGGENCGTCPLDCGSCDAAACGAGCAAGKECIAGECQTPCIGSRVPGDYSTIQEAINALSPVSGTICVAPGTYAESLSIGPASAISVRGASASLTTLSGSVTFPHSGSSGALNLWDFTVTGGISVNDTTANHPVVIRECVVQNSGGSSAHGISVRRDDYRPNVTITRCDVSAAPTASAVMITESSDFSSTGLFVVDVFDSYLHDSAHGVRFLDSGASNFSDSTLSVLGNTILDNETALLATTSTIDLDLTYRNNLFAGNGVGVSLTIDNNTDLVRSHSAYFDNGVNFKGSATPDASDVFADPKLDFATVPPGPDADSPLIGAGASAASSGFDYFGNARDTGSPDIGAVEFLCASTPCVSVGEELCGDGACNASETCASCSADCGACDASACTGGCRADQFCVEGACEFLCSGARVPGDYNTIQEAVTAIGAIGGAVCVEAGTYSESLSVAPQQFVDIIGVDAASTSITGTVTLNRVTSSGGDMLLQGLTAQSGVFINDTANNQSIELYAMNIRNDGGTSAYGLRVRRDDYRPIVTVDACDIAGAATSAAVQIEESSDFSSTGEMQVWLNNCYVHDSATGVNFLDTGASNFSDSELRLVHCTILDNADGIVATTSALDFDFYLHNTIVSENEVGLTLSVDGSADVFQSDNAFFGNATNFDASAVEGPGYILSDPMLDYSTVPPGPGAGSPLINAGDTSNTLNVDFFGDSRDALPDIGAVEAL